MPGSLFFVQQCPACCRSVQVRVDYLGKGISCPHCHAEFVGSEDKPDDAAASESGLALLDRADELLKQLRERAAERDAKKAVRDAEKAAEVA
ncbi:MAG: hypothetical protein AAFV43_14330 [Planctomycetota bacterium]